VAAQRQQSLQLRRQAVQNAQVKRLNEVVQWKQQQNVKRKRQEEMEQLKEAGRKIDAYMAKVEESDKKKEEEKKEKAESEVKTQDEEKNDECEEEDEAEDEAPAEDLDSDSGVGQTETDEKQDDEPADTNIKKPVKKGKKKWVSIPGEFWV
jgi:hypothetical protein